MAILYLGVNNNSKKISKIYIGVNNNAKKVLKAYIGIDNKAKLFYHDSNYLIVKLDEIHNIDWIGYTTKLSDISSYAVKPDNFKKYIGAGYTTDEDGYYSQRISLRYYKNIKEIYLNKNSSTFFVGDADAYAPSGDFASGHIDNFLPLLKFDEVENMYKFFDPIMNMFHNGLNNFKNISLPQVKDMNQACARVNLLTPPLSGPNVINMVNTYLECWSIQGDVAIGEKVNNAYQAYYNAGIEGSTLNLNYLNVGKYGAINLSHCFENSKIKGNINIYNISSNISYSFFDRVSKGLIKIHYPKTYKIETILTKLQGVLIRNFSEKHVKITSSSPYYIDIQQTDGTSYNIKIYNDAE